MDRSQKKVTRRAVLKWGAAGLAVGAGAGMFGNEMQVTERTLRLPKWNADGFRIAQVSDAHVVDEGNLASVRQAVKIAVAAKPDLLVFTGDYLNHDIEEHFRNIPKAFEELEGAACPCLAILGNHDHWCGAPEKVVEWSNKTRLKMLVNQEYEMGDIRIVGLDSGRGGKPDLPMVNAREATNNLVLLHEPDYLDVFHEPASLVLSGHSHGGEMCLPGGIAVYTPKGSRRYKSGYYPDAPSPVYVNRGTATLGPTRLYCPTEVCIFTLRSA